jgi:hypothetical protein
MGGQLSIATADNIARLRNNTSVVSTQNCYNSQFTSIGDTTMIITNFNCQGTSNIGDVNVTSKATCNQYQDISIVSKAITDQMATSQASNGLGFLNAAIASSSNIVDIQNNVAATIASSCTNAQKTEIGNRSITIDGFWGHGDCNVLNVGITAEQACVNNTTLAVTTDSEASQTATATAKNGVDLGELLLILLLIFGGGFIFSMFGIVMKFILKGNKPKSKSVSISELKSELSALRSQVSIKTARAANFLPKPVKA